MKLAPIPIEKMDPTFGWPSRATLDSGELAFARLLRRRKVHNGSTPTRATCHVPNNTAVQLTTEDGETARGTEGRECRL
jgi:hypothetical protein